MPLELRRRLRNILGASRRKFHNDDFNWDTYTRDKYAPQQEKTRLNYVLQIDDRVRFDAAAQKIDTGGASLHPNVQALYGAIGILSPKSVLEVGCGGGDHVHNLKKLYPNLEVRGGDRSSQQLAFLRARNPEVANMTFLQDITMPLSTHWPRVDLVYSQAVIMHIKTAVSHLTALANMFSLAEKHVVLMENFGCHPFVDDINRLHQGGHLRWDEVHFHVQQHNGRPRCLVVSREPCVLPKLEDYFLLPHARKIRYAA